MQRSPPANATPSSNWAYLGTVITYRKQSSGCAVLWDWLWPGDNVTGEAYPFNPIVYLFPKKYK